MRKSIMGSLYSQFASQLNTNRPIDHRIYASFCSRDASTRHLDISNWLECYNPADNSWDKISTIPGLIENHVLKGSSMVSIGDSIYIIGGRLCQKVIIGQDPDEIIDVDLEVRSSVLRYDVRNARWSKCAPLSVPRFDFACTVNKGKIYVAGGKSELVCPRGTSSAEMYDPVLDEWKALPEMNTLRYKCVGVTWRGKIHVVGGFAEKAYSNNAESPNWHTKERSSAEVYNFELDTWELVLGMWKLDVPPNQIANINENLYSSGDCLNVWKGHIEAYDGKLSMWDAVDGSHLENLSSPISTRDDWPPTQRAYLTMAPIGTDLYFLAGYRMPGEISRTMSVVHVFDTSANGSDECWTSFEPMVEEGEKQISGHCCVFRQST